MPDYWLDSDALMRPKDGPYSFQLVPQFWRFIEERAAQGVIASSVLVYREICKAHESDPLRAWAEARPGPPLFREPSEAVQRCLGQIADFVNANYRPEFAAKFLGGADPWLIAHAKTEGGKVVTFEALVGPNAKEPKIPNVCRAFGVSDSINTYQMLIELKANFG